MGTCILVNELNRLRKSSSDSIDSEKQFDEFKQYMHVRRRAEDDLKEVLRRTNASSTKTLVLVCGSAGDGKSHILSYLKNYDPENLLSDFIIHNDATESSAPNKTAIQTLNEVLDEFSDDKLDGSGKNLILAINLGVLNNFIESEYGHRFSKLREYVEEHYILSSRVVENGYEGKSHFQHVSFSDYQLYTLTGDGAKSQFISTLLSKVYLDDPSNPFFQAFQKGCEVCPLKTKCPVRYNFLFLQNEHVRDYVSQLLVMAIVKNKMILTTRELLNYFYDITVPQNFTYSQLSKNMESNNTAIRSFLKGITPALMFDQSGVSTLMEHVKKEDPLIQRSAMGDERAVQYYVSEDVSSAVKETLKDSPYGDFFLTRENLDEVKNDAVIKGKLYGCLIRLQMLQTGALSDGYYDDFVKTLFYYNKGDNKKIGKLFEKLKMAILSWSGSDSNDRICIDSDRNGFSMYENVTFDEDTDDIPVKNDAEELERFLPEIHVGYNIGTNGEKAQLDIDFSMFQMIRMLNEGYIHTTVDTNDHADFMNFVEKLKRSGNAVDEVIIVSNTGERSILKHTKFVYTYEVL